MDKSQTFDGSRPLMGSIYRYISDWVGADSRQPPPFRPPTNAEDSIPEAIIEMQHLVHQEDRGLDANKHEGYDKALHDWTLVHNIDTFLEQAQSS